MNAKKLIKELEKQLRKDQDNPVTRLKLAAAYRDAGRIRDAVELYRSVACTYRDGGRLVQAIAVCKSALEIGPGDPETSALLSELERAHRAESKGVLPADGAVARGVWTPPGADAVRAAVNLRGGVPALIEDGAERLSTSLLMPTPLPAPLAPHDADQDDSLVLEEGMERYKLPIKAELSGPVPDVSLPGDLEPLDDEQITTGQPGLLRGEIRGELRGEIRGEIRGEPSSGGHAHDRLETNSGRVRPIMDYDDSGPTRFESPDGGARMQPPAHPGSSTTPQMRTGEPQGPGSRGVISGTIEQDDEVTHLADPRVLSLIAEVHRLGDNGRSAEPGDRGVPGVIEEDADEAHTVPISMPSIADLRRHGGNLGAGRLASGKAEPVGRDTDLEMLALDDLLARSNDTGDHDEPTAINAPAASQLGFRSGTGGGNSVAASAMSADEIAELADEMDGAMGDLDGVEDLSVALVDDDEDTAANRSESPAPAAGTMNVALATVQAPALRPEGKAGSGVNRGVPDGLMDDATTGVASLPPRRDGLPHVIHDDLELGMAFHMPLDDSAGSEKRHGPFSIFSSLPPDALSELAENVALRHYGRDEVIVREGEPASACYVIVSGAARVLRRDPLVPDSEATEVARLGDGALFGEYALLPEHRRQASVRAIDECHAYEIPRRLLRELAASYDEVASLLDNIYRERLLGSTLAAAPYLRTLSSARLGTLRQRFETMRVDSGDIILEEGTRGGGLYVVVLGAVEVIKRLGPRRGALLATLGEGAYVADMAIADGEPAKATVRAFGPAELMVLPPQDFYELVAEQPGIWDRIRDHGRRRELERNQLLTGEATMV